MVKTYDGILFERELYAFARVLREIRIRHQPNDSLLRNLWNSIKRFNTRESPNYPVRASIRDNHYALISDVEGYLPLHELHSLAEGSPPLELNYHLSDSQCFKNILHDLRGVRRILCTDIDDTIIHTDVHSKRRMLYNSLLKHPMRRRAVPGAAEWLNRAATALDATVIYVSNSPYNLFDYLKLFLQKNEFPLGPMFLRDFSFSRKPADLRKHAKYQHISTILSAIPKATCYLVGDNVEHDPQIYTLIQRDFADHNIRPYIRQALIDEQRKIDPETGLQYFREYSELNDILSPQE